MRSALIKKKNRSNIIASILQNGDILEQVREASVNDYFSSSDEELNKYLDSIEGRVAQFQNRLQELISTTIDSSWIKGIIDFGTKAIEVITFLTDAFGGLNMILGTVVGAFAQFKGFGIASFDKNARSWTSGLEKIGTMLGGKFGQKFSNEARLEITNWFDGFDSHKNLMEAIADSQVVVPDAIYDYAEALGDVAQKEVTVGDAAMAMSQSFSKAEGLAGKLKNGLIGIFSGIGTSLLFSLGLSLATSLFSSIWKAFDENIFRADEIAIERGDKLRDELGESRTSYQNSDKSARSMVDRYMELRKGVQMSFSGITNISLPTDEYNEFLNINQQLADVYPALISGASEQGTALVNLGSSAEEATKTLDEYLRVSRLIQAEQAQKGIDDIVKSVQAKNEGLTQEQTNGELLYNIPYEAVESYLENPSRSFYVQASDYSESIREAIYKAAKSVNISNEDIEEWVGSDYESITYDFSRLGDEAFNNFITALNKNLGNTRNMHLTDAAQLNAKKDEALNNWRKDFLPAMQDILLGDVKFTGLSDEYQSAINSMLYNFDWTTKQDIPYDKLDNYVLENMVWPFADAITNASDKDKGKIGKAVTDLFSMNYDDLTTDQMDQQVNNLLAQIFPDDKELQKEIAITLGYKFLDENGNLLSSSTNLNREVYSILGGTTTLDDEGTVHYKRGKTQTISYDEMNQLTRGQKQTIVDMRDAGEFANSMPSTLDALIVAMDKFNEKRNELVSDGKMSDIFKDENFTKDAETYKTGIEKITSAIQEYKENGKIDASTKADLASIDGLAEYLQDDDQLVEQLLNKRQAQISDYINFLKQTGEDADLTPSDQEGWNNYIRTIIESLGDLEISAEHVGEVLRAAIVTTNADYSNPNAMAERADQQRQAADVQNALISEFGSNLNAEVLFNLAFDSQAATWEIEDWIEEYNNSEIAIKIRLEEEELQQLENTKNLGRSRIDLKQANSEIVGSTDYDTIIESDLGEIDIRQGRYERALELKTYAEQKFGKNSKEYRTALDSVKQRESDLNQVRINYANDQQEQLEAETNRYKSLIDYNKQQEIALEQEVARDQKYREQSNEQTIKALHDLYMSDYDTNTWLADFWQEQANETTSDRLKTTFQEKSNTYRESATTSKESADKYTPEQNALNNLQLQYEDYANQVEEVNNLISLKQAKGLKANVKDYETLANLTKKQIRNLKDQNAQLRDGHKLTEAEQETLRSNESTINDLYSSLLDYQDTAKNLAVSDAMQLASTISTAMSEMTSETGLTAETMRQITTGFSELGSAADISSIFYSTADGVKVDMMELQRLAEEQNKIVNQNFADEMSEIQEAMDRLEPNTDAFRQAQDELADLQRRQAQYLATYKEQMEAFARLSAIARADQTKNEGADYETAQGYMKTAKEMFDKGLIGTDDFKTRAAYLDPFGRTDWKTFEQNYKKAERYFTDDSTGVTNFLNDLKTQGLATYDALTGWSLEFADSAKAALQMGMSDEFFMDMMGRLNDFGFGATYVSSLEEASVKMSDLQTQWSDAQVKLQQMTLSGADITAIEEQKQVIMDLETQMQNLTDVTENYKTASQEAFAEGAKNLPEVISGLNEAYQDAVEKGIDTSALDNFIKDLEDKYGITINVDFETGEVTTDNLPKTVGDKFLETVQSQTREREQKAEEVTRGTAARSGAVDATIQKEEHRLEVAQQIKEAYENQDSQIHTVLSTLAGANVESLSEIVFGDHELASGDAGTIETAIDGLLSEFGLAQEDGKLLIELLQLLDQTDPEIEVDTDMEEANEEIERGTALLQGMQAAGKINVSFDMTQDPTTITDRSTLESHRQELVTVKTQLDPNSQSSAIAALDNMIQKYDAQIHIQTILDGSSDAQAKLQELQALAGDKDAFTAYVNMTLGSETQLTESEIEQMRASLQEMSASDYPITVKIADNQMSQLTSAITDPTMDIHAQKAEDFDSVVAEAESEVTSKQPIMQIRAANGKAIQVANSTVAQIQAMNPSMSITANTSGISSAISSALTGPFSIKINATVVGMPKANGSFATGTMTAHSTGTAYNVLNYKPVSAYAGGRNVTVGRDENALVGELSPNKPESIVRDGKWMILPGGPHVEHLKKDDIVFSAQQTEDLLKHGRTGTPGHLIGARALASGTVAYNGMSAYGPSSIKVNGGTIGTSHTSQTGTSPTTKIAQQTGKQVAKSVDDAAEKSKDAIQKAIEAFQDATKNWFDSAEIVMERTSREIEHLISQSELAVSTRDKNSYLDKASKQVNKQISQNERAQKVYTAQADEVRKQAVTSGLVTDQQANDIIRMIQSGNMDDIKIANYDEGVQTFIQSYKEWYDKILDCKDANVELQKQLKELQGMKLDNIVSKYGTLAERSSAIQASTKAMLEYYQASGGEDREVIRQNMGSQIVRQKEIVKYNEQAMKDYEKELANAAKIYGVNSKEYQEAQTQLAQLTQEYWESKTSLVELQKAAKNAATELAQAQFDKADKKWGGLLHMVQSSQKVTQSKEAYYTATGTRANSGTFKQLYNQERVRLEEQQKYLSSQYTEYTKILRDLEAAGLQNTDDYHEAKAKLFDLEASIWDTNTAIVEMGDKIKQLDIDAIGQAIERLSRFSSALKGIAGYYEKVGTRKNFPSVDVSTMQKSIAQRRTAYQGQIDTNNLEIVQIDKQSAALAEQMKQWEPGSDKWNEGYAKLQQLRETAISLATANLELSEAIRKTRWEPFERIQRIIKETVSDFEHLNSLISDAEIFDTGDQIEITEEGYAKLALYGAEIQNYNQLIANERGALEKLHEEYDAGIISMEQYEEESRQHIETIQQSVSANEQLKKSIIDVYKTQITNENKALQDLISLRKDALSKKKA